MAAGQFVHIFYAGVLAGAIYPLGMVFMLPSPCDMSMKYNFPAIELLESWDF